MLDTPPPNIRDETWYEATGDSLKGWERKQGQHRLVQRYIDYIETLTYTNLSVIPVYINIDTYSGYPENDPVHPNDFGYEQIANSIYSWIKFQLKAPIITSTEVNESSIVINWEEYAGADSYKIYRSEFPYTEFEFLAHTTANYYEDTDIAGENKYFYKITAEY